ncbi:hypothetical protein [Oligosphaera ethanolica]|uniref:Uncharacterized protein n=1 Tax=Oligosphaera ethanolica TaxID=760260 RepID=A0AAE4APT1_9BACT|nr:hypothetical protein [Oligosphaera ethanolica]MDQ0290353.1 hypothetical protein [Oligosphaera ethanolica]
MFYRGRIGSAVFFRGRIGPIGRIGLVDRLISLISLIGLIGLIGLINSIYLRGLPWVVYYTFSGDQGGR